MKNKIKIAVGFLVLVLVSGAVYAKTSHVTWNMRYLAPTSIAPNEKRSFTVAVKNEGPEAFETEHVRAVLSGDVALITKVRPMQFPEKLRKGDTVAVTLDVAVPSTMPLSVLKGSLLLVREENDDSKEKERDKDRKQKGEEKKFKKIFLTDALPIELTLSSIPLPPDPGEAGKQTVLGIDSNENGVRDDVERYIVFANPQSEKTRMALTQYAKEEQKMLADANDKEKTIANAHDATAQECMYYIFGGVDNASIVRKAILAEILNTKERSKVYIHADGHLGGQGGMISSDEEDKASCDINPDTLAN